MTEPDYKHIIDSATEYAIFTTNTDGLINSWNTGAERLLGWSEKEAVGQHGSIIFPDENNKQKAREEMQSASESESATDEDWHVKKDGSQFWALGRMMTITDDSGEITGYVKILLDQTDRKRYEQQLKQMNETLEERIRKRTADLVSYQNKLRTLASELNKAEQRERHRLSVDLHDNLGQILAVCRMELDLIRKQLSNDEVTEDLANVKNLMDEAIKYTRELMSDLKPPTGLNDADLMTMMSWLRDKMKKHGLKVFIEDDKQPKPLSKDMREALLQSVRELLFNVIKHAGVDEAHILLKRINDQVQLTVKDGGRGFNPEDDQTKSEYGGFGLFNIKERISLLGGSLKIDSEPDKGSTVTLITPVKEQADGLNQ